jgi:hypothetical protein
MESKISYMADGTTQVFHSVWNNEPFFVVFTKTPKRGTIISVSTKEPENE